MCGLYINDFKDIVITSVRSINDFTIVFIYI